MRRDPVALDDFKPRIVGPFNEVTSSKMSFYSAGQYEITLSIPDAGAYEVTLRASCTSAQGELARFRLTVDDHVAGDVLLTSLKPEDYILSVKLAAGEHRLGIEFTNDLYVQELKEDRNLFIHHVSLRRR